MKMQRSTCLIIVLCLLNSCAPQQDKVERIIEEGVEVVFNHREPYTISGPKTFTIEKILTIDTENDEVAQLGLTDISRIEADSEGNIFALNLRATHDYIFIFNKEGSFISSFGNRGEGPGELQNPLHMEISARDEVFVTDRGKAVVFSNTGEFIKEFRIDSEYMRLVPLNTDRYLAIAVKMNEDLSQSFQAILCSSDLMELKILDSSKIGSFRKMEKVNIIPTLLYWETSGDLIFTGNTEKYEIKAFDINGKLVRKIRKEYEAVLLTEKEREGFKQRIQKYPPDIKDAFFIPEAYPPFQNIVALENNRLFVQTYEESKAGIFVYDIYSPEGIYINRVEFEGVPAEFLGENVYCLNEKSSGYIELVVYKMIWN